MDVEKFMKLPNNIRCKNCEHYDASENRCYLPEYLNEIDEAMTSSVYDNDILMRILRKTEKKE